MTLLHKPVQDDLGDKEELLKMFFTVVSPRLWPVSLLQEISCCLIELRILCYLCYLYSVFKTNL